MTENKQRLTDAVRTTGQLLLHSPTTHTWARDGDGVSVSPQDPEACCFCYVGATEAVAAKLNIPWEVLDKKCDFVIKGFSALHPSEWDTCTDEQRKAWATKLANFKG